MPPLIQFSVFNKRIHYVDLIGKVAKLPQVSACLLSVSKVICISVSYLYSNFTRYRRQKRGECFETQLSSYSIYLFTWYILICGS